MVDGSGPAGTGSAEAGTGSATSPRSGSREGGARARTPGEVGEVGEAEGEALSADALAAAARAATVRMGVEHLRSVVAPAVVGDAQGARFLSATRGDAVAAGKHYQRFLDWRALLDVDSVRWRPIFHQGEGSFRRRSSARLSRRLLPTTAGARRRAAR